MEWLDAIANVGFPIAITGYLLLRFEGKMDQLTKAVSDLAFVVRDKREA